jgi:long-chain acyl-CoA synthetase
VADPRVQSLYQAIVEQINQNLAQFEQLKKFLLVAEELSIEDGTLTPTLKLRRRNLEERYRAQIEQLYSSSASAESAKTS